jgi:flagellar biosynthesis GTPase FlhF
MVKTLNNLIFIALVALIGFGSVGCRAKRIAKEEARQRAIKIEDSKQKLNAILNDEVTLTLEEKEKQLEEIKALNLDDPELNDLISKVELKLKEEREEIIRKEEEELKRLEEEKRRLEEELRKNQNVDLKTKLTNYFNEIATAGKNADLGLANSKIEEALQLFNSEEAVVLIIISEYGDTKDYDRPTTIKKYLNYLKDSKQYSNTIYDIILDTNKKISELELKK